MNERSDYECDHDDANVFSQIVIYPRKISAVT